MMSTKLTMTDAAYNIMLKRKKEMEFPKLWAEVAKSMKIPEEKLSRNRISTKTISVKNLRMEMSLIFRKAKTNTEKLKAAAAFFFLFIACKWV